jgi:hypothetical protein
VLRIDKLAGRRHAHGHALLEAVEGVRHAGGQVSILRVGGCFFEGAEVVFTFVVFFFAAVGAVLAI